MLAKRLPDGEVITQLESEYDSVILSGHPDAGLSDFQSI
jgi:hypothetical protein